MSRRYSVKHVSGNKGRGIVANSPLKRGTMLEEAPVLVLSDKEYEKVKDTRIFDYLFEWDADCDSCPQWALAMGTCEFINHSYEPNCYYELDYEHQTIRFRTLKYIRAGEELTVNYNGSSNDRSPVWFEVEQA